MQFIKDTPRTRAAIIKGDQLKTTSTLASNVGQSWTSSETVASPIYNSPQNIYAPTMFFGEFFPNFRSISVNLVVTIGELDHRGFKEDHAGYIYSSDGIFQLEIPSKTLPVTSSETKSYGLYFDALVSSSQISPGGDDGSYFSIKDLDDNPGYSLNGHFVELLACFYPDASQTSGMTMTLSRMPGSIIIRDMWITF